MQTAIYNNKLILAYDYRKKDNPDPTKEPEIRRASDNGQLTCPDKNCENNALIFKEGPERTAHFAHKSNCKCPYYTFTQKFNNKIIEEIKENLFKILDKHHYDVEIDKKVKNNYIHILFKKNTGIFIATPKTTIKDILEIKKECEENKIKLSLFIICNNETISKKQTTIKTYLNYFDYLFLMDKSNIEEQNSGIITKYSITKNVIHKTRTIINNLIITNGLIMTNEEMIINRLTKARAWLEKNSDFFDKNNYTFEQTIKELKEFSPFSINDIKIISKQLNISTDYLLGFIETPIKHNRIEEKQKIEYKYPYIRCPKCNGTLQIKTKRNGKSKFYGHFLKNKSDECTFTISIIED